MENPDSRSDCFSITKLEKALKHYYHIGRIEPDHVLTAEEMIQYISWMMEQYENNPLFEISFNDIPSLLNSAEVVSISKELTGQRAAGSDARNRLFSLFEAPMESKFFEYQQDISAGRFFRYFPAYWNTDEYFLIYYVFSGKMLVMFEQEILSLDAGSVLFIPPGINKACTCPTDDTNAFFFMIRQSTFSQVFWAHLSAQNLMSFFFQRALSGEHGAAYLLFDIACNAALESLLYAIYKEYNRNGIYSSQIVNSLMSTFFLFLLQGYENTARISRHNGFHWDNQFANILRFLETHYETLTVKELAVRFGYSTRQLIRIIHSVTGKSFSQIQTELRMQKAARMLTSRTASMEAISAEIGFANLSSFYRAFKKFYNCSPKEYAASHSFSEPTTPINPKRPSHTPQSGSEQETATVHLP